LASGIQKTDLSHVLSGNVSVFSSEMGLF
jgi:hypothetical protein